jgi:orotidine-5'-phosphate decarboxylase
LCVGLDPDPQKMPISDVFEFCKGIVDSTASVVAAYKPNLAFYEALGLDGLHALKNLIDYIHAEYPEKLTIGDAKRGDIGSSSEKYAYSLFEYWGFDAITVNAFAGKDSITPFLNYKDKGTFLCCKS